MSYERNLNPGVEQYVFYAHWGIMKWEDTETLGLVSYCLPTERWPFGTEEEIYRNKTSEEFKKDLGNIIGKREGTFYVVPIPSNDFAFMVLKKRSPNV